MPETEDQLTHDERLRLECLAQAVHRALGRPPGSDENLVTTAATFERYVRSGVEANKAEG